MLYMVLNKCKTALDALSVIPQSIVVFASLAGGDVPDLFRSVRGRFFFRTETALAAILCLWVDLTLT